MPGSSPDAADTSSADNELLGTTTDTADGSAAEVTQTQDSTSPETPPAAAGTMLDAVQAALEPKGASPAPKEPDQADDADPNAKPAEGAAADEELTADELKALSWKTQQRFKKLSSTVKAKDSELTEMKPKAEGYDRIVGAIKRAGIDNSELDELVELGGWLKTDQRRALETLKPIVQALEGVVGEVLSPELQERVRLGYITEEDARTLSRSKAGERLATQRAEKTVAERQAEKDQQEFSTLVKSSTEAVEAWDKQKSAKDPDWHLKQKEVAEQVELAIVRESNKRGKPYFPTAEEAVKLADTALKTINDRLQRFKPRPAEIRPATPGASTRSKPAPKTTLDAINNAL